MRIGRQEVSCLCPRLGHGLGGHERRRRADHGNKRENTGMEVRKLEISRTMKLWSVTSDGDRKIWAAGEEGNVLHSEDAGDSWHLQYRDERQLWRCIARDEQGLLWVVGNRGRILYSEDEGARWEKISSGTGNLLNAVSSRGTGSCWVSGRSGTLLKVTGRGDEVRAVRAGLSGGYLAPTGLTSGDMVQPRQRSLSGFMLNAVAAVGADHVWVAGSRGLILYSPDGGDSWAVQKSGTDASLCAVFTLSKEVVLVAGAHGVLLKTEDGGESWTKVETGVGNYLRALYCFDHSRLWVSGWGGLVMRSTDGGRSWDGHILGETLNIEGIAPMGTREIIAVGSRGSVFRIAAP